MNRIEHVEALNVGLDFGIDSHNVGRLLKHDGKIYFEFGAEFLSGNLEVSPYNLPLKTGLQSFDRGLFEGLPGVFDDCLPDGWGRVLFNRKLAKLGQTISSTTPLDRLAHVGTTGIGALTFEPEMDIEKDNGPVDLDWLSKQVQLVLEGEGVEVLDELVKLNGSSAGARPKALIGVNDSRRDIVHGLGEMKSGFDHWIVKFPNSRDGKDAGAIEYVYSRMATEAGVEMMETHLFPASDTPGFFATKRFDRRDNRRFHIHSVSGLLNSAFWTLCLDYRDLVVMAVDITGSVEEAEKMYRLAVFNALAHNRDDHGKNFSFMMDEKGNWKLAPAYDLNFSHGIGFEQSTMILGEGNPSIAKLKELGKEVQIATDKVNEIIEQTVTALNRWPKLAKKYGVRKDNISMIQERIGAINSQ